ncbi:MAG: hypothetical protein AAGA75_00560 [Cyanobacteria bacterium P01_E01_bin.6]
MKKLLCLLLLSQGLFSIASSALAQTADDSPQATDGRYSQIEEGFISDCMNQPMPAALSGVRISDSVRTNYCNCWFDYVKSNFSYEEFSELNDTITADPTAVMTLNPQTLNLMAQGFQECYDYAIEAQQNAEPEQNLAAEIEQLEEQIAALLNQRQFEEATLVAEQIVEKKTLEGGYASIFS